MFRVMACMVNQRRWYAPDTDMTGKHVVVTGPTKGGIGFETAYELYRRGAYVTLAARSQERGRAAAEAIAARAAQAAGPAGAKPREPPAVLECDTGSLESVRAFAAELAKSPAGPVDVLVCNAGAQVPTHDVNAAGVELTFAVCALGHHLMTHLVKPRRLVWVTGDAYAIASKPVTPRYPSGGMQAYANACLARLLLARELHRRAVAGGVNLEVTAVHPGVIDTEFAKLGGCLKRIWAKMVLTPEQGAQASVFAASCPSSQLSKDTVYYHNKHGWMVLSKNDLAMNDAVAKALFDDCDAICGIQR